MYTELLYVKLLVEVQFYIKQYNISVHSFENNWLETLGFWSINTPHQCSVATILTWNMRVTDNL